MANAKPKIHCFGHIHSTWGAKRVVWNKGLDHNASFYDAIDNERSETIEAFGSFVTLPRDSSLSKDLKAEKRAAQDQKRSDYLKQGYASASTANAEEVRESTLFVNAAVEGGDVPWLVNIDLTTGTTEESTVTNATSMLGSKTSVRVEIAAPASRKRKAESASEASVDGDEKAWRRKRVCT